MDDSQVVEKYQQSKLEATENSDTESLLELLESLENDDALETYREERLSQLKKEFRLIDRAVEDFGDLAGTVHYKNNEKELMDTVANANTAIVHFYQPAFSRCQAMNDLLSLVAEKHLPIQVLAIQAEDAPFLVSKLKVKILPFVVIYKQGREVSRIVGFEGIGGSEKGASLQSFEAFLMLRGLIDRTTTNTKSVRDKKAIDIEEDSGDDWY